MPPIPPEQQSAMPSDAAMIAAMSAPSLGQDPMAAAQAADPTLAAAAQPQQPPQQDAGAAADAIQKSAGPNTEGDRAAEDPVDRFIRVNFGENDERTLSENQIRSTFDRYRDLNYRHQTEVAPYQPVLDLGRNLLEGARAQGQQVGPQEVASFLDAAVRAYVGGSQANPNNGAISADPNSIPVQNPNESQAAFEQELAAWEAENGMTLPPAMRQAVSGYSALQAETGELKGMLAQILQQAQGVATTANQQVESANRSQAMLYRQAAVNNLQQAQQQYGLPDDAEEDFFSFAMERGYTIDDFIDPNLTNKVVGDFNAVRATPEMERLRSQAMRRQAYTGSARSAPGVSGSTPQPTQDEQLIGSVTDQLYRKRNIG